MVKTFKVGDRVSWNSEAGRVRGKIVKVYTRNVNYKGYVHHASRDKTGIRNKERQNRSRRLTQGGRVADTSADHRTRRYEFALANMTFPFFTIGHRPVRSLNSSTCSPLHRLVSSSMCAPFRARGTNRIQSRDTSRIIVEFSDRL